MGDTKSGSKGKGGSGGGVVRTLAKKLLMPIVATAVSAAAAYATKKGPELFEEKVLPRFREAGTNAGDAAQGVTDRAKSVGGSAATAAHGVADRTRSAATESDRARSDGSSEASLKPDSLSNAERERRWKQRADDRAARRKALAK